MKILKLSLDKIEKVLAVSSGLLLLALCLDVALQVVGRYVFHAPPPWTEELARRLSGLMVYVAGGVAYRRSELTGITLLVDSFSEKCQKGCRIFVNILIMAFCAFLTYIGYRTVIQIGAQLTPALRLPKWPFFAVISFFGGATVIFAIEKILEDVFGKVKSSNEIEGKGTA